MPEILRMYAHLSIQENGILGNISINLDLFITSFLCMCAKAHMSN